MNNHDETHEFLETASEAFVGDGLPQKKLTRLLHSFEYSLDKWKSIVPSRDDVLIELVKFNVGEIENRRIKLLDEAQEENQGACLSIEDIVDARLLPVAEKAIESILECGRFQRGLARLFNETPSFKRRLIAEVFPKSTERFISEFSKSLPKLCKEEIEERFWMSHSSILGSLGMLDKYHLPENSVRSEQAMWKQIHLLRDAMCALFRAPSRPEFSQEMVHVRSEGRQWQIPLERILCIESDGDYSTVHLQDETSAFLRRSMKEWEIILPENAFLRIHRSWIVNRSFAKLEDNEQEVHIEGVGQIPISRRKHKTCIDLLDLRRPRPLTAPETAAG